MKIKAVVGHLCKTSIVVLPLFVSPSAWCADNKIESEKIETFKVDPANVKNASTPLSRQSDPMIDSLIQKSKEQSSLPEYSAHTNYQRALACEKLGQTKLALDFLSKSADIIQNNLTTYDPKFAKLVYEKYAQTLRTCGHPKEADSITKSLNRYLESQVPRANATSDAVR